MLRQKERDGEGCVLKTPSDYFIIIKKVSGINNEKREEKPDNMV